MPHLNDRRWAMFENNKYKVALIKNYNLIQRASRKSPKISTSSSRRKQI